MNVIEIVFSPTGGTSKAASFISRCWSKDVLKIDLCNAKTDFTQYKINKEDMVLVAMPSFGGRAPAAAIERLKKIAGNGAKCTLVCVYGNRAYEDTLAEMEDAAKASGFCVIAAVAAVAEHSILPQYGAGRPDASDKKQLAGYAKQIAGKVGTVSSIPGNRPYKESSGVGLVPKPSKDCTKCGLCAENCPLQAIHPVQLQTDSSKCISCMRCVKHCPSNARKINSAMVFAASIALKKACSVRKENELFL